MEYTIPSTPFGEIEEILEEEREIQYKSFRKISAPIIIIFVIIALIITAFSIVIGFLSGNYTILYIFVPILLFHYGGGGLFFAIMILIETTVIIFSAIHIFTHVEAGLISDFKKESNVLITFSEAFLIGYSISIILIMLMPFEGNFEIPISYIHLVVLAAPFWEEVSFRFLWLALPIWLIYRNLKKSDQSFKNVIIRGVRALGAYEWLAIILNAFLFGFMHYFIISIDLEELIIKGNFVLEFEFSWPIQKVVQASVLGVILGYLAVRYGFPMAIAFHWMWNSFSSMLVIAYLLKMEYLLIIFGLFSFIVFILGLVAIMILLVRFVRS